MKRTLLVTIGLSLVMSSAFASRAPGKGVEIRGGWIGIVPCVPTNVAPSERPITTLSFSCRTSTFWDGSWTGQTSVLATGTLDLVTGDASATYEETFVGMATADHSVGTLRFAGTLEIVGATNTIHIVGEIVGGTGDFAGSRGTATYDGVQVLGVAGHGGYYGTWTRP